MNLVHKLLVVLLFPFNMPLSLLGISLVKKIDKLSRKVNLCQLIDFKRIFYDTSTLF